jgi:hypothetical protein
MKFLDFVAQHPIKTLICVMLLIEGADQLICSTGEAVASVRMAKPPNNPEAGPQNKE